MLGGKKADSDEAAAKKKYSRRDFLAKGGVAVAAPAIIATATTAVVAQNAGAAIPRSQGYIVFDSRKCIGCTTCMLSCSLTHYGEQNLSLSRIQIIQDSFGKFPNDLSVNPCRQCVEPPCVRNCPVGAAHADTANGNVRLIDESKCIGCRMCLQMCPQQPRRTVWNSKANKSSKCDLCINTPHWKEKGGPGGKQACVEVCPVRALKFVSEAPNQEETNGYQVNLRNDHWWRLGLVDDSRQTPPPPLGGAKPKAGGGAPSGGPGAKPGAKPKA
jgi:protein NrfC